MALAAAGGSPRRLFALLYAVGILVTIFLSNDATAVVLTPAVCRAGLLAGRIAETSNLPDHVRGAVLIGVDLGPNLSATGSLATILWLGALRREGIAVSAWQFLTIGAV